MKPLVSICIPTRNRPEGLRKSIDSFLNSAKDKSRIEFILKFDDDDPTAILFSNLPGIRIVSTPRGQGYIEMPRFAAECFALSEADWCVVTDDDVWIEGHGWDEQLANIPPVAKAAQPEFYHLGQSKYGSGSCGPNCLFVPTPVAKQLKPQAGAADELLYDATIRHGGFELVLLRGITYCHDGRARAHFGNK